MSKIEKVIIALGAISFVLLLYFIELYSWLYFLLTLLPVFFNAALFVLSLRYREKARLDAAKIIADAHITAKQIIDNANNEISRKNEELFEQQIDLIDKEKRADDKVEQYKKQMQANMNAMHAKNMLLKKIKQIAFANRDPKSKIEEIKRRLYEL